MSDDLFARALTRIVPRPTSVSVLTSSRVARDSVVPNRWLAIVAEAWLADGSGLDVLATAREHGFSGPALVVAARVTARITNRSFELGATILAQPVPREHFRRFVDEALQPREALLALELNDWRGAYELSVAELNILELAVRGLSEEQIALERHVSVETVWCQVKSILRKAGDRTLKDAAIRLLWEMRSGWPP